MKRKFNVGQTIYVANKYSLGKFTVVDVITHETKGGKRLEYGLEEFVSKRQVAYSQEDIVSNFFGTLEEAKIMAMQNWKVIQKRTTELIENFSEKQFNDAKKEYDKKQKQAKK